MPPHTRAVTHAESSRLTPTVLQHRVCSASSTLPFRFRYSPLPMEHCLTGTPLPSAHNEEVIDEEIKYEPLGEENNKNNPVGSKQGLACSTKDAEPEELLPIPGVPQAQAAPLAQVPPPAQVPPLAQGAPLQEQ